MKVEFLVTETGEYNSYVLFDKDKNKTYKVYFELYDVPPLEVNDKICIEENLLNRRNANYAMPCAFEVFNNKTYVKEKDLAIVKKGNKEYKLKRVYG